jgi:TolB-like protein/DNA-binding winged helix-turn-helix (wHTH) protein/tetratricopeptide (TPR) repeat protein
MAVHVGKKYTLSEFQLEPDKLTLSRDGGPVHLTSKPFQVLLYLVEHRDRFVSRAELFDRFWQGKDVYDVALTRCVSAIRKALDDQADHPRFIETRWAEGYRYIGPLEEQAVSSGEALFEVERARGVTIIVEEEVIESEPSEPQVKPVHPWRVRGARLTGLQPRTIALALAVAAVALAALILGFTSRRPVTGDSRALPIRSIAVLPFKNLTGDPTQDYFSDGVTESLISELSKINGLKVISRASVFTLKDQEIDPHELDKRMGVAAVLEGSVRRNEDTVRVTVRLISTADGQVIWAGDSANRALKDILAVQDEIGCRVATEMRVRLCDDDKQSLSRQGTNNIEAYQAYLKGRYYLNQRTAEGVKKSLGHFQQAIELDRRYALAYAGLSNAYSMGMWFIPLPQKEATEKAREAATRALEIDPRLGEAHYVISEVLAQEWNWAASNREIEQAIELSPGDSNVHHGYALFLNYTKRPDEAITEIKRAQELDPLSMVINTDVGLGYYYARRYDEAIEALRAAIKLDPNFGEAHWYLAWVYAEKGWYKQALEETEKAALLSERTPDLLAAMGYANARAGKRLEAQRILRELNDLSKQRYVPSYAMAAIYAALGQAEEAMERLEKAFAEHSIFLINMAVDPMLDSLRSDPRFQSLVRRVGLPE